VSAHACVCTRTCVRVHLCVCVCAPAQPVITLRMNQLTSSMRPYVCVCVPPQPVTTLRVNQLATSGTASAMPRGGTTSRMPPPPGPSKDAFFDERMGTRGLKKLERRCACKGVCTRPANLPASCVQAWRSSGEGARRGVLTQPISVLQQHALSVVACVAIGHS